MSESPRRVHFVAIAGSGMGSLAGLLHARGLVVTGSDDQLYPPMSTVLERAGIPVHESFRAEHVLDATPDLVVIGNAVRPDNPEARAAIDEGLNYRSFPDALYELAITGRHSVVVSGTHGKTTTTSLIAPPFEHRSIQTTEGVTFYCKCQSSPSAMILALILSRDRFIRSSLSGYSDAMSVV